MVTILLITFIITLFLTTATKFLVVINRVYIYIYIYIYQFLSFIPLPKNKILTSLQNIYRKNLHIVAFFDGTTQTAHNIYKIFTKYNKYL